MPNIEALTSLAARNNINFTGFLDHGKVEQLARAWMPDINFHEDEWFHVIDLEDLYTRPADVFPDLDGAFGIEVDGDVVSPPIVRRSGEETRFGANAQDALLLAEFHFDAVYSHGGSLAASDAFFASETEDTEENPVGPENPRLPRWPLRVRAEFRMLLEVLKYDLALSEELDQETIGGKPVDAIWGDFDVTDLLLLEVREVEQRDGSVKREFSPARRGLRHSFARDLIAAQEAEDIDQVRALLDSPPSDFFSSTVASRTVWNALSTCGFLEFYFVYAYNDFKRHSDGVFANEHEGDVEGCCIVFERERLAPFQTDNSLDAAAAVAPLGLITAAHEPLNRADESVPLDTDPGDARDGLDVYVARGSHATYPDNDGDHRFFDLTDLLGRPDGTVALILAALALGPLIFIFSDLIEDFLVGEDVTSDDGVTGQGDVDPNSDPNTHLSVGIDVTPLSDIADDVNGVNIYDLDLPDSPALLARRAFGGVLGEHDSLIDHSPPWKNKTRRYFEHLVKAIRTGLFRPPQGSLVEFEIAIAQRRRVAKAIQLLDK